VAGAGAFAYFLNCEFSGNRATAFDAIVVLEGPHYMLTCHLALCSSLEEPFMSLLEPLCLFKLPFLMATAPRSR
jgi:hypothetical protein